MISNISRTTAAVELIQRRLIDTLQGLVYALAVFACIGIRVDPDVFSVDHALALLGHAARSARPVHVET